MTTQVFAMLQVNREKKLGDSFLKELIMFDVPPINRVTGNVFFAAPHPIARYG